MTNSRRRGLTIVEVLIVVLIIGILATVAVPYYIGVRQKTWTESCRENLRQIDQAKQLWLIENGHEVTAEPTWADLAPKYIKQQPGCKGGGSYTIRPCNEQAFCSVHGQY